LYLFPRRYEDRSKMTPLSHIKVGAFQTVQGKVLNRSMRKSWYTKKHVTEIIIDDGQGRMFCVWFNQPYLDKYFKNGTQVVVYGKVDVYKDRLQMVSPEYEIIGDATEDIILNTGRIVPVYPLTKGMTQRYLRKVVRNCLDKYVNEVKDLLPVYLRNKHKLFNIRRSLTHIHFPDDMEQQQEAHRRISFEEFFFFQVSVIKRRMSIMRKDGFEHKIDLDLVNRFKRSFPFTLTQAQDRVVHEIAGDMQKASPMLRLLQGDVGSGKTVVALFGCLAAYANGHQSAIMAPTEILALQHYMTIAGLIKDGPFKDMRIECLVSSLKKSQKDDINARLKEGQIDILIGTHALLSETVDFADLSFLVIDEQHKFGVRQRALLSAKGINPDVLIMTATPIPRTLSLTLYGDLDVSVIDEMPSGRGEIETRLFSHDNAQKAYALVKDWLGKGQQAYIVYPIIEESEKLDLKAAEVMYEHFKKQEFKDFKVGLLHGRMKKEESESIMRQFKANKIQILVATTVLEVGVDVPSAGVMVIEHAERFGLSQMHQLRGRVGRGCDDGLCILVADANTEEGGQRLKAICSTTDGFKIAEMDLMIRGPGHYFGRHQHGLNELKFANPMTQLDILEVARTEADELVHQDPDLSSAQNLDIKNIIRQRYPDYLKMVEAG